MKPAFDMQPDIRIPAAPVWKKVEKNLGIGPKVLDASPSVARHVSNPRSAILKVPYEFAPTRRCSIYHDGGTKLAFAMVDTGEFVVSIAKGSRRFRDVRIPALFADLIPFGTQKCVLQREHGMLILDTATLTQQPA